MKTESKAHSLTTYLTEWEKLYRGRVFALARMELYNASEDYPELAEVWFLKGMTELAMHDTSRARESFDKALEIITRPGKTWTPQIGKMFYRIPESLALIIDELDAKTLTSAPPDPFLWLNDPLSIKGVTALAGLENKPLGRVEPLVSYEALGPIGSFHGSQFAGIMRDELPPIRIQRDSMDQLLGKDRNIRIERGRIIIIDPSVKIQRDQIGIQSDTAMPQPAAPGNSRPFTPAARTEFPKPSQSYPAPTSEVKFQPQKPAPPSPKPYTPPYRPSKPAVAATAAAATSAAAASGAASDKWELWEKGIYELIGKGKGHDALNQVGEALQRFPTSARLNELKAEVLQNQGRYEEAVHAYMETYRQAMQAGSQERAHRALQNATELAKENSDLLLDIGSLAVSLGSVGMAVTIGKLAADVYRRRDDRPKLMTVLKKIQEWAPGDSSILSELMSLELSNPSGSLKVGAPPPPQYHQASVGQPSPLASTEEYQRTAPPSHRTPVQPRTPYNTNADSDMKRRAERAMRGEFNKTQATTETPDAGTALLGFAIVAMIVTVFWHTIWPGAIGAFFTHSYIKQMETKASDKSHMAAKMAKVLFIITAIMGLILP